MHSDDLMSKIHKVNPYIGFKLSEYPLALDGWHSEDPIFKEIINEIKPKLIIEVGTWKGASAIYMASYLREIGLNSKILCIDTWLGSVDFWGDQDDPEKYMGLSLVNGYPTVYYQFLANVLHKGLQDYIIPFPQTSLEAWRWLELNEIKADLCYIDASHNQDDVYNDLNNYWDILNPGGALYGDDYDQYWPTVKSAVDDFVADNHFRLKVSGNKWFLRKKDADTAIASKSLQQKLMALNKGLQEVQYNYLQYQKMHCRMRDRQHQLLKNNQHLREDCQRLRKDHQQLCKNHQQLCQEHDRLRQSRAIQISENLKKYPILSLVVISIYDRIKKSMELAITKI
jgi:hypothetical protein